MGPYRRHLDVIQVKEPCREDFAAMEGDDAVRFCRKCEHNVYDLSQLTRGEAERLIEFHEGRLCVRFRRRADGTLATADCAPLLRTYTRRARKRAAVWVGAVIALIGAAVGARAFLNTHPTPRHVVLPPETGLELEELVDRPAVMGLTALPQLDRASPAWTDPADIAPINAPSTPWSR